MRGYVYVLTNEAMPGLVKVGRSKHAAGVRAKQIYAGDTGVPLPFDVYFECLFDDCIEGEALVHEALQDARLNPDREFFKTDAEVAALEVMNVRAGYYCHEVNDSEMVVSQADILNWARILDRMPPEIVTIIEHLDAEELQPGAARWDEKLEAARKRREAQASA